MKRGAEETRDQIDGRPRQHAPVVEEIVRGRDELKEKRLGQLEKGKE